MSRLHISGGPLAARSKLLTALLVGLSFGALGCDDPCEKLQKKVCEDPVYVKANKRHCEILSESARREALPGEFCTSILDSLAKR